MIATPLDARSGRAVRDVLVRHGWDPALAADAAAGLSPVAVHIEGLDAQAIEALVPFAGPMGLEVVTGSDWVVVAGGTSRLGALARPWTVPPQLADLATAVAAALPAAPARVWRVRGHTVSLDAPVVVGILNVTPDSFSDGGLHRTPAAALAHAERLVSEGAEVLDLGGESTRPGRETTVGAAEELARLLPILRGIVRRLPDVTISVDTMKADVAYAVLAEGAHAINDVTALRHEPALARIVADAGAGLVLMHSRGTPLELASYVHASYGDLIGEVRRELLASAASALEAGVSFDRLVLDPGLGFSKRPEQNILIADQLRTLVAPGYPVLVGPSRKRFLGVAPDAPLVLRDAVTAVCCALCYERGARLFRVHDVATTCHALRFARDFGGQDFNG